MTNTATISADEQTARVDAVVDELVEIQRGLSALHARRAVVLVRAVEVTRGQDDVPGPSEIRDIPLRSMAAQIGAALRVPDRTVERDLSDAIVLTGRFPGDARGPDGGGDLARTREGDRGGRAADRG